MEKPKIITGEDLEMLRYFWKEKGDLTRYIKWGEPDFQAELEQLFPEIPAAMKQFEVAERTLTAVLDAAVERSS
jgi:hypothetical protein